MTEINTKIPIKIKNNNSQAQSKPPEASEINYVA